jgi:hypothetical protein
MTYQQLNPLTAFLGSVSTITTIGIRAPNIVTMPSIEKGLLGDCSPRERGGGTDADYEDLYGNLHHSSNCVFLRW